MSKVSINETTLTAIGDAIRAKTGKNDLIAPGSMPDEIASITTGGGGEVEPIVLTGSCEYACSGPLAKTVIDLFPDKIITTDITSMSNMFYKYSGDSVPFELNFSGTNVYSVGNYAFKSSSIKQIPKINNLKVNEINELFASCYYLRDVPQDLCDNWNWSYLDNSTSAYAGRFSDLFVSCWSLRSFPMALFEHGSKVANYSYSVFDGVFTECTSLDEIIDYPNPHYNATYNATSSYSMIFSDFVKNCYRLKNLTFRQMEPVNWANQILDLTYNVGYIDSDYYETKIIGYNSGITADKRVKDDATYQALKNDPDWYAIGIAYSRYNHDSAVATINSLPSAIEYQTSSGKGANIIKFKGAAGSATDGGAINTLTEEEIAVAAAKGWTVTLS